MRKLTFDEIKRYQFDILVQFKAICNNLGIRYSLCYGTLLGALRHRGYIPWDDDIDVALARDDYEKLLREYEYSDHSKYLKLYDYRIVDSYNYPFMKLADSRTFQVSPGKESIDGGIGLHIDIFAIDGLPKIKWLAIMHLKLLRLVRYCGILSSLKIRIAGRSFVKKIVLLGFKILTIGAKPWFWNRLHNYLASRYALSNSHWGGNSVWGYAERELVPVCCYEGRFPVCFENEEFWAFSGADEYLKTVYGNYMTPPPVEQQVGIHVIEAYINDEN